jgi:hypothetical protein
MFVTIANNLAIGIEIVRRKSYILQKQKIEGNIIESEEAFVFA